MIVKIYEYNVSGIGWKCTMSLKSYLMIEKEVFDFLSFSLLFFFSSFFVAIDDVNRV